MRKPRKENPDHVYGLWPNERDDLIYRMLQAYIKIFGDCSDNALDRITHRVDNYPNWQDPPNYDNDDVTQCLERLGWPI